MKPTLTLAAAIGLLVAGASHAQTSPPAAAQADTSLPIPLEVYEPPHSKHLTAPNCDSHVGFSESDACRALLEGFEGWTELNFMVDPSGKPFEVSMTHSSGRKEFDALAVKSLGTSSFVPASLNGVPIESGMSMKYEFTLIGATGAKREFIADYTATARAIEAGDRAAADVAVGKLEHEITNLYEDAYYGMASYLYAKKWGDQQQQLDALARAIAEEDRARYLPGKVFKAALQISMQLQLSLQQYAEALDTYKKMQTAGIAADVATALKPVLANLDKLRTDATPYAIDGRTRSDGSWHLHLFKRHFQVRVAAGYVAQAKLRCQKRYLVFTLDPNLQYEVNGKAGDCWMELDGSPAATFKLIQF
ncbi:MAG TPA: TonB family protein [Steroidobacteraceae bacterium]|nr:TonB family protein [Steroidobacteraceae bacterium]